MNNRKFASYFIQSPPLFLFTVERFFVLGDFPVNDKIHTYIHLSDGYRKY